MRVKPLMRQNITAESAATSTGQFLNAHELKTLAAACARLIPQPDREPFLGIARTIDYRLAAEQAGQWAGTTAQFLDAHSFRHGLRGLDEVSHARLRRNFADLDALRQDQILASVERGIAHGQSWSQISPQRFFEELLHEATEIYQTAPVTEEAV
jgi:gluconate 2-dehydrogenase gamma chain